MIRLRYKILAILALLAGIVGWLHFKRPIPTITLPGVDGTTLTKRRTDESKLKLPDYGHGNIIIVKKEGNKTVTTITPKVMGMPFDFGASGAIGGKNTELYLTTEIAYYRHAELLTGVGISYPIIHPRVMLAVGYRLPWKDVDNISLFAGYNFNYPIVGIYGRFGSN